MGRSGKQEDGEVHLQGSDDRTGPWRSLSYEAFALFMWIFPDYEVGSSQSVSDVFSFVALDPKNITRYWYSPFQLIASLRVCIYGDLSVKDGFSIPPMTEAAQRGDFDIIVHIGELSFLRHVYSPHV